MDQPDDATRDLLFGLIALRDGLIDRAQLVAGFRAWTLGSGQSLAEILVGQGALDERGRTLAEGLVAEHSRGSGGDPASSATVTHAGPGPARDGDAPGHEAGAADVGRYRVLRFHARGGLGAVFVARDVELDREVALKELRAERAHDPASQARFLREAEVTGRLEHPGVVPVYGLGRHADGRPYYATRFIEGETLGAAIERFHRPDRPGGVGVADDPGARELAFRRLLRGVIDACNTVAYAHSRGVVHRDIKPENIMLGRFGETIVVDWGVARPLDVPGDEAGGEPIAAGRPGESSLTRPGAAVGTPTYMSPEQAAGDADRVGPASDVYGLGATLYCVLAGRPPFRGGVSAVLRGVLRGDFPPPGRVRRGVDPGLEAICLKAMAGEPGDRHASPTALADDLERWLADVRFRGEQEVALNRARRSLARLGLERAHNLFGRERHGEGMLWLARALGDVPQDSPDLRRVILLSLGGWHPGKATPERSLEHRGAVHAVAFGPDGRLATACEDGSARLWDVATGTPLAPRLGHGEPVHAVAFGPDGRLVATAGPDGTLRRWDAATGEPVGDPIPHGVPVRALAFSPDGSLIATAGRSGVPCLWSAATGVPVAAAPGRDAEILAVLFSTDGALLAASCDDGRVWIWSAASGDWRGEPLAHGAAVASLAFGPDGGCLLTGCRDGKARLWDLDPGPDRAAAAPPRVFDHPGEVGPVHFRPGGVGLAVATACHDGHARLWDAAAGAPIGEPMAHRARVHCLAFSPDGATVATGSWDGTGRLWDADTGLPIGPPLPHRDTVLALAFSPDGHKLVTGGADGTARSWRVPAPVAGDAERVACWVGVETGLEFDAGDAIRPLDPLSRMELRRRLQELGGPPVKSERSGRPAGSRAPARRSDALGS